MTNLVEYQIARPGIPLLPIQASLYEYVMAGNGIFLCAQRCEFQAQLRIARCDIRGLAELKTELHLNASLVPRTIVEEIVRRSQSARDSNGRPCEIVFHLELDTSASWVLHVPEQSQAPARVKPADDSPSSSYARACIELHSHVNMNACFSCFDDRDEVGFRIYVVLGCLSTTPTLAVRIGVYGYHQVIPARWVFELPDGLADAVTGEGTILGPTEWNTRTAVASSSRNIDLRANPEWVGFPHGG